MASEKKNAPEKEQITKTVTESYIFTTIRHNLGIYTERLMLRLVEMAQNETYGLDFKSGKDMRKITVGEWGDAEVTIPVKDILSGEDDKNYSAAKQAIRNLMGKFIEYEDDRKYRSTHILNDVDLDKVSGKMIIRVNRNIWNAMLDFSKGFRRYELETAVKLHGKYSLRIYKLISKQKYPLTIPVEDLRKMWGLEDKYKKMDDFVKNTIEAAKKELDSVSPYSFTYTLNASKDAEVNRKKRGRPAITSVTFIPQRIATNDNNDALRKSVHPTMILPREIYDLLKNKFLFDDKGIKSNITLFDYANREFDLVQFLYRIAPGALHADTPQGYVVNSIKKHLKEDYGILFQDQMVIRTPSMDKKPGMNGTGSLKDIIESVTNKK